MSLDPRMETEYRDVEVVHGDGCDLVTGAGTRCTCAPGGRIVSQRDA